VIRVTNSKILIINFVITTFSIHLLIFLSLIEKGIVGLPNFQIGLTSKSSKVNVREKRARVISIEGFFDTDLSERKQYWIYTTVQSNGGLQLRHLDFFWLPCDPLTIVDMRCYAGWNINKSIRCCHK
jgi:hypothetical protein